MLGPFWAGWAVVGSGSVEGVSEGADASGDGPDAIGSVGADFGTLVCGECV